MSGFWTGVKSVFGFDGVAETALKIIDKVAGTDWTPKEQADYVLQYMEATKHQSPARRFIAICITAEQVSLVMAWLVLTIIGEKLTAKEISDFLTSNINVTQNIIVSFYFLSHMVNKSK